MTDGIERSNVIIKTFLLLVLISILTGLSGTRIKGHFFGWDPLENTIGSLSLINQGSISDVDGKPTNLREPVPIIIHAAYLLLFTDVPYSKPVEEIITMKKHRAAISKVNLVYVWLTLVGVVVLSIKLNKKYTFAATAVLLTWFFFLNSVQHLYSPHTEIAASMFLVFVTIGMINLFRDVTIKNAIILGVFMGLFSLTKMPATYVSLVAVPLLLTIILMTHKINLAKAGQVFVLILIAFSVILAPWVFRNYQISKQSNHNVQSIITQRGGNILNMRANFANRALADIPGHLYVFAPMVIKETFFERSLGFKRQQLWPGGRYDVKKYDRPDHGFKREAIKAGKLKLEKKSKNNTQAKNVALSIKDLVNSAEMFANDSSNKKKGINKITANPSNLIKTSLILAWRGMWSFSGKSHPPESYSLYHVGNSLTSVVLNLFCFASMLLMPLISLAKKKPEWLILSIFSVGFFWIYALFSHFIPRYSAPLIPISIISFLLLSQQIFSFIRNLITKSNG